MDEKIAFLALADSVNPCTLAIMVLLLSVLAGRKGRRKAVIGGILFTGTVYIMYTLYGLGLLTFIMTSELYNTVRLWLPLLVLVLVLVELRAYISYKPGFISLEMPTPLRPLAKRVIRSVEDPLIAIPVAALCSVLLLPCSSGPYLTALFLMRGPLDLLLYNAIFVLPMALILLLFVLGTSLEKIKELREKHIREIHLISGLLLLVAFFLLLPRFPWPQQRNTTSNIHLVSDPSCPHCQHLKEVLRELNIQYTEIAPEEGARLARERNVEWDGGVPLLIVGDTVIEGFPSRNQDVNGYFPEEELLCRRIGRPVYEKNRYLYCKLRNGALLGNRYILETLLRKGLTQRSKQTLNS